jgi:NTE family protein
MTTSDISGPRATKLKTHRSNQRPPFERIALVLQGGGALGAYQGGVYQALAEADLHPDWVAGISIGAFNSALIAGNPPEKRVARLREFWEIVSTAPFGIGDLPSIEIKDEFTRRWINEVSSLGTLLGGAPGFFKPRVPPPFPLTPSSPDVLSYYDAGPLRATLERLVDFDLINSAITRFSVGAVNVRTANLVYFDNTRHDIGPEHIMASGSLPPGLPATEIEGEYYWDGGLVSNTPLEQVLSGAPRQDTLAFQIDLWSASGRLPGNLIEADERQKDIRFSSRTRAAINQFKRVQLWRRATHHLLERLPDELRQLPQANLLAGEADEKVYNIINLIYHTKNYEGVSQDYEFSRRTMEEHWQSGYNDAVRTLRHPEVLQRPENHECVFTFDLARDGRE